MQFRLCSSNRFEMASKRVKIVISKIDEMLQMCERGAKLVSKLRVVISNPSAKVSKNAFFELHYDILIRFLYIILLELRYHALCQLRKNILYRQGAPPLLLRPLNTSPSTPQVALRSPTTSPRQKSITYF